MKKSVEKKSKKDREALGVAGFTLGIMSIVLVLFLPLIGIVSSIVGFVFCFVQQKRTPTKFGKTGMILNVVGLIVNIAWWVILINYVAPLIEQQLQGQAFPA